LSPVNNTQAKKIESFTSSLTVHLCELVEKIRVVKASNDATNAETINAAAAANFDINFIKTENNIDNNSTAGAGPAAKRINIEH
jgi:hypothetical protein